MKWVDGHDKYYDVCTIMLGGEILKRLSYHKVISMWVNANVEYFDVYPPHNICVYVSNIIFYLINKIFTCQLKNKQKMRYRIQKMSFKFRSFSTCFLFNTLNHVCICVCMCTCVYIEVNRKFLSPQRSQKPIIVEKVINWNMVMLLISWITWINGLYSKFARLFLSSAHWV
jgi:hypothetical protein